MDFTVDGASVFAATGGKPLDAAKPYVVLVHGAGMDHTVWSLQTRWLAHQERNVLALDLPGHGASSGPALASIAAMADWLAKVIDAVGAAKAAVVGHSMGALAALELARRHPARLRGLMLLGIAQKMPVHPDLLAAARDDVPKAAAMITDWGFGAPAQIGRHPVPGLWMAGGGQRLVERSPPATLHADLAACDAWPGIAEGTAPGVDCPSVVVVGGMDRMTPAKQGRALAARLAKAQLVEIPGAGHMMMVEAPDDVRRALAAVM
ncbi:MAG: alpha/beta hydrolase [Alphaproteobacteria bacterium]|nr:alpha/beta hydrolase [Alphaproteobacteria bacterium]